MNQNQLLQKKCDDLMERIDNYGMSSVVVNEEVSNVMETYFATESSIKQVCILFLISCYNHWVKNLFFF